MTFLKETPTFLEFRVLVVPRSSRNSIAGVHDDMLKVKLTAPPVDGAANKACVAFLAKHFQVPKSTLEIASGLTGRRKSILVRFSDDAQGHDQQQRIKSLLVGYQEK